MNEIIETSVREAQTELIQAAYLMGFEPSADDLTGDRLYQESEDFIYTYAINQ